MITIYHNPRCSKSRLGLQYLEGKGVEFQIRLYLKELFTIEELSKLIAKTGLKSEELVRKHEALYKQEYKGTELSDEEWIVILVENPRLLHRPIVENGDRAVWAQPVENMDEIL